MTNSLTAETAQSQTTPAAVQANPSPKRDDPSKDDGMSFSDLLGVINPLQHIPIISTVYRELTGDTISPAARIAGDALYGGLIGLGSSIVNEVVESTTGNDIGGHIWATLFGDDSDAAPTQLANAGSAPAATPTSATSAQAVDGATVPVTPLNGPTSFFQGMQQGAHHFKGVPLSTTVPVGTDTPRPDGASTLLQAQGPNGALSTQANQAAALGTSGISASTSTPPPAIPAAPPTPTLTPPPSAQGNIADKMMMGLDAYKALALQQDSQNQQPVPAPAATDATGATTALMN